MSSERPEIRSDGDIYDFVLPNDEAPAGQDGEGKRKGGKKGGGIGNIIAGVVMVIALGVFCYAGYNLFHIYNDYHGAEKEYAALTEYLTLDTEQKVVAVDFDSLRAINPDVVGWLRFDAPEVINYPVVKRDNEYYLTHTFEGTVYGSGTLFIDESNEGDFTDSNTFIYGHNMKNGSMFGELPKYLKEDFYKEHPYFYLYTSDGRAYKYQVFSMYETTDESDSYEMSYTDGGAFEAYVNKVRARSNYFVDPDVPLDQEAKVLTLSTCTNETDAGRYLLHAVRVGEVEVAQEESRENEN